MRRFPSRWIVISVALFAALALGACTVRHGQDAPVAVSQLISIRNARVPAEEMLTGGQPTREQLEQAAAAGYRTVIDLRPEGEEGALADERTLVSRLGMRYVHIPISGAGDLNEENARLLDEALSGEDARPVLFHCASGNRVGALLALKSLAVDGAGAEEALAFGKSAGLTSLEQKTRELLGL